MVNHPNSVKSATKNIPANSKKNWWITTRGWVTLWLFNIAMENPHAIKNGMAHPIYSD